MHMPKMPMVRNCFSGEDTRVSMILRTVSGKSVQGRASKIKAKPTAHKKSCMSKFMPHGAAQGFFCKVNKQALCVVVTRLICQTYYNSWCL